MLRRALALSIVAHAVLGGIGRWALPGHGSDEDEVIDIDLAPEAPEVEALPEEHERPAEPASKHDKEDEPAAGSDKQDMASTTPHEGEGIPMPVDAGIDAPIDAPPDAPIDAARPDARPDAPLVAVADAGVPDAAQVAMADAGAPMADAALVAMADAGVDAPAIAMLDDAGMVVPANAMADAGDGVGSSGSGSDIAMVGSGSGSGSGSGDAGKGSDHDAIAMVDTHGSGDGTHGDGSAGSGSGSGSTGSGSGSGSGSDAETAPGVDGAPTTAGTAANLIAYFPSGHVITALIRFDRLRGTEWAAAAEKILKPLPDYKTLFDPASPPKVADSLDMVVISSPSPKDVTATTLVAKTALSRSQLRDLLTFKTKDGASVAWSSTKGGLLGKRAHVFQNDKRVILSPFKGWFVLAQPGDLPSLASAAGDLDKVEASAKLPTWLAGIRTIESESGDPKGPALVVTFAGSAKRYTLPDVGLGVTAVPGPDRVSLAMELVKQGWLVRGNIKMASEADAKELETAITAVQQKINDSTLLRMFLKRSKALNAVTNLSIARNGDRISYATSVSISDARALLQVAAQMVDAYFASRSP